MSGNRDSGSLSAGKSDRKKYVDWLKVILAALVIILVAGLGYVVFIFWAFLGGGLFR